jgi:hypothetical protein
VTSAEVLAGVYASHVEDNGRELHECVADQKDEFAHCVLEELREKERIDVIIVAFEESANKCATLMKCGDELEECTSNATCEANLREEVGKHMMEVGGLKDGADQFCLPCVTEADVLADVYASHVDESGKKLHSCVAPKKTKFAQCVTAELREKKANEANEAKQLVNGIIKAFKKSADKCAKTIDCKSQAKACRNDASCKRHLKKQIVEHMMEVGGLKNGAHEFCLPCVTSAKALADVYASHVEDSGKELHECVAPKKAEFGTCVEKRLRKQRDAVDKDDKQKRHHHH